MMDDTEFPFIQFLVENHRFFCHHREDECSCVLTGECLFEAAGVKYTLLPGATIWAPRDIPHVWADVGTTCVRMILMCQHGIFENFFDGFAEAESDKVTFAGAVLVFPLVSRN